MKNLILVRHGQTEWNLERRFQGQRDTNLNEFGRQQMGATGRHLLAQEQTVDQLVTSPLVRAQLSADIIAEICGLDVQIDHRLVEMNLGGWEGERYAIGQNHPGWFELAPHGGESGGSFHRRIQNWFIAQPPTGQTMLLVVHGLVIQSLVSFLLEEPFDRWHRRPIRNGALTVLSRQEWGWRLEKFNEEGSQ